LHGTATYDLVVHAKLKLAAEPGESERDFRARVAQAAREARDADADKLRAIFETRLKRLEGQLAREEQDLAEDKAEASGRVMEEAVSGLSTLGKALGLFGRRSVSGLSSAARRRRLTASAQARAAASERDVERLEQEIASLDAELQEQTETLTTTWGEAVDDIERIQIAPRRTDVKVEMVAVAWLPYWYVPYADARDAQHTGRVPAFALAEPG
jgi:hypothetical protein